MPITALSGSAQISLARVLSARLANRRAAGMLALLALAGCAPLLRSGQVPPNRELVERAAWGADPPVLAMRRHVPRRITIHHTAVERRADRTLEEKLLGLQRFSQGEGQLASGGTKPPWADVPYHFYIDRDGRIGEGRPVGYAGDTNTAYDPAGHVLIVVEGNFELETPGEEQLQTLAALTWWQARKWRIAADSIGKHNDFADTLCPGRNLEPYLPWLREYVRR